MWRRRTTLDLFFREDDFEYNIHIGYERPAPTDTMRVQTSSRPNREKGKRLQKCKPFRSFRRAPVHENGINIHVSNI